MIRDGGHVVFLALGSSMGDRAAYLRAALSRLGALPETRLERRSKVYESRPEGGVAKKDFLNMVVRLRTRLSPARLLAVIEGMEDEAGRRRERCWDDRTLDIDILYYDARIIEESRLLVPHPRIAERRFVLVPLAEIAPDFIDPARGLAVKKLLDNCPEENGNQCRAVDHFGV